MTQMTKETIVPMNEMRSLLEAQAKRSQADQLKITDLCGFFLVLSLASLVLPRLQ
ncbi:hypothetical protein ACFL07_09235 [Pseudomonadota bacterium]